MAKKAARGRPPIGSAPMANPVAIRFPLDQLELIDDLIEQHPIITDRNTMVRHLVEFGVPAMEKQIKLLRSTKQ